MKVLTALSFIVLLLMPPVVAQVEGQKEFIIRGKMFCVNSDKETVKCSQESRDFSLVDRAGQRYFFLREDSKSKMFWDPRVRQRELEIRVWKRSENTVEIIKVYSIVEGRRFDIHYFCSICNITAYGGGPCWCCQEDFELRETPVP